MKADLKELGLKMIEMAGKGAVLTDISVDYVPAIFFTDHRTGEMNAMDGTGYEIYTIKISGNEKRTFV